MLSFSNQNAVFFPSKFNQTNTREVNAVFAINFTLRAEHAPASYPLYHGISRVGPKQLPKPFPRSSTRLAGAIIIRIITSSRLDNDMCYGKYYTSYDPTVDSGGRFSRVQFTTAFNFSDTGRGT